MKLRNLAITFLALVGIGYGQQSNTIYKLMAANIATAPYTTANVPAIGQSQHIAYALSSSAPGHTCVASFNPVEGYFQASYDGTNYFPLTAGKFSLGVTSGSQQQFTLFATGLAPYVRITLTSFDFTNCRITLYYGGSLYPSFVSKMENSKGEGGWQFGAFTTTNVGDGTVVPAKADNSIVIYGITCSSLAAASFSVYPGFNLYVPTNGTSSLPNNGLPYFLTNVGAGLTITKASGSASDSTCTYTFRYEL